MKSVSIKLFFHMYMDCSASVAPPLPPPTDFLLSSSDEAEMESLEEANPNLDFLKIKFYHFWPQKSEIVSPVPSSVLEPGGLGGGGGGGHGSRALKLEHWPERIISTRLSVEIPIGQSLTFRLPLAPPATPRWAAGAAAPLAWAGRSRPRRLSRSPRHLAADPR